MDVTIVVLVVLAVGALYGVGGYLLRDFGHQVLSRDATALSAGVNTRQEQALADVRAELETLRMDIRTAVGEGDAQLARLRERRERAQEEIDALLARARDELVRAEHARQEAEGAVKRSSPDATAPGGTAGASSVVSRIAEGRLETLIGLYGRLARVETALAQLTTPILLPGEPYEVPEEVLPEALRWDNWKEVGETAYALGDYLTEHRLLLPLETGRELETGMTALRVALTRSIYPNLQPVPTPDQATTLRVGLDELARTLPHLRQQLEADYRALADAGESGAGHKT